MVSPSFSLTAPLLYTNIFPIKPAGSSSKVQVFSAGPAPFDGFELLAISCPSVLGDGFTIGIFGGNWRKNMLASGFSSYQPLVKMKNYNIEMQAH